MPRPPREEEPGAVFHVCGRGNRRAAIYEDDEDRVTYLRLLERVVERTGWRLLAWCLMTNHVHLLVETVQPNLASGMQWLHGRYARHFNDRHDRVGHLFQGRYAAARQKTDAQLRHVIGYIVENPVAAGLCGQPREYPWSSHRWMLTGRACRLLALDRVAWYLGVSEARAVDAYAALLAPTGCRSQPDGVSSAAARP